MPHLIIHVSNIMDEGAKVAFLKRTRKVVLETYLVNPYTGVDSKNIHAVIHEIPPDDYFGAIKHQH
jgi:phenylpyruvate tautomerase PptA (4-oxalocrotonate tautomerase family)